MARKQSKSAAQTIESTLTLDALSTRYITHLEEHGKSAGTCFSYLMELKLAQGELGAETLVSTLTPKAIAEFNTCSRVMKLKTGRAKSQLSIDKTRRVLRLALTWAHEAGLVAERIIDTKRDLLSIDDQAPTPTQLPVEPGDEATAVANPKPKRARKGAIVLEVAQDVAVEAADVAEAEFRANSAA